MCHRTAAGSDDRTAHIVRPRRAADTDPSVLPDASTRTRPLDAAASGRAAASRFEPGADLVVPDHKQSDSEGASSIDAVSCERAAKGEANGRSQFADAAIDIAGNQQDDPTTWCATDASTNQGRLRAPVGRARAFPSDEPGQAGPPSKSSVSGSRPVALDSSPSMPVMAISRN